MQYVQALCSLLAVLALIVAGGHLLKRSRFVQGLPGKQGGGTPTMTTHALDMRTTLRTIQVEGREYRVLQTPQHLLLLEARDRAVSPPIISKVVTR